jgi:hypothetical protein
VFATRLNLRRDVGRVAEEPDLMARSQGELPGAADGQPHRPLETAQQGGDAALVAANRHQLAGLVGGHQQGDPEFLQQLGEPR